MDVDLVWNEEYAGSRPAALTKNTRTDLAGLSSIRFPSETLFVLKNTAGRLIG